MRKILLTTTLISLMSASSAFDFKDAAIKLATEVARSKQAMAEKNVPPVSSAATQEVYTNLGSEPSKFRDVFKGTKTSQSSTNGIGWPRVALTFLEWGKNEKCWKVQADIWSNETNRTTETFKICDFPYIVSDSVGEKSNVKERVLQNIGDNMRSSQSPSYLPNTNLKRTLGPLPPKMPFKIDLSDIALSARLDSILARIALVSSFYDFDAGELDSYTRISNAKGSDTKMWLYKFNLEGKK